MKPLSARFPAPLQASYRLMLIGIAAAFANIIGNSFKDIVIVVLDKFIPFEEDEDNDNNNKDDDDDDVDSKRKKENRAHRKHMHRLRHKLMRFAILTVVFTTIIILFHYRLHRMNVFSTSSEKDTQSPKSCLIG
jgi:hypothetical protein